MYDHLWIESGCPSNILLVSIENLNTSKHLNDIIYGKIDDVNYDGIHLRGKSATLHYSYQVVKMLQSYLPQEFPIKKSRFRVQLTPSSNLLRSSLANCNVTVHDSLKLNNQQYAVPTYNRFESLNC